MHLPELSQHFLQDWYSQFREDLIRFAVKLGFQHHVAEDIVHQLFLELWEKQIDLQQIKNPRSFLLTACKHKLIDHSRRTTNNLFVITDEMAGNYAETNILSQIEEKESQEELRQKLGNLYAQLPPRLKEILYQKYYMEMPSEEIARHSGLSIRTVYNSLFEALKKLRQVLAEK